MDQDKSPPRDRSGERLLAALEAAAQSMVAASQDPAHPSGRQLNDFWTEQGTGLLPGEIKLATAAQAGELCELSLHDPLDVHGLTKMTEDRDCHVRASFLRFLLLGGDSHVAVHETGLRLRGAFIHGSINLNNATIKHTLAVESTAFDKEITAHGCNLHSLEIRRSVLHGISARDLRCDRTFLLSQSGSTGDIDLANARIGGSLVITHCRLTATIVATHSFIGGHFELSNTKVRGHEPEANLEPLSLILSASEIGGSCEIVDSELTGTARLAAAKIGGSLKIKGSHLESTLGTALLCDAANISCGVAVDNSRILGVFRAPAAVIRGPITINRSQLGTEKHPSLLLSQTDVSSIDLKNTAFNGHVDISDCQCTGTVNIANSQFLNKNISIAALRAKLGSMVIGNDDSTIEVAGIINAGYARIDSELVFKNTRISGGILLLKTSVKGHLVCRNCEISGVPILSDSPLSINAEAATIGGSALLERTLFDAAVILERAEISGDIDLQESIFRNSIIGLNIRNATIGQSVKLINFKSQSSLIAEYTKIGADFIVSNSKFERSSEDSIERLVRLDGAHISRDLFFSNTECNGFRIRGSSLSVDNDVHFTSFRITNATSGAPAISLFKLSTKGLLRLLRCEVASSINLSSARIDGDIEVSSTSVDGCLNIESAITLGDLTIISSHFGSAEIPRAFGKKEVSAFCSGIRVGGSIRIADVQFDGAVSFADASAENLRFAPCRFGRPNSETTTIALDLQGLHVERTFAFVGAATVNNAMIEGQLQRNASEVHGSIDYTGANFGLWAIDTESVTLNGFNKIYGLDYESLLIGKRANALSTALSILHKQPTDDIGLHFKPQPFEKMVSAYRVAGHENEAQELSKLKSKLSSRKNLLLARQSLYRNLTRPTSVRSWLTFPISALFASLKYITQAFAHSLLSLVYGGFLGYGYAKAPPIIAFILLLMISGKIYDVASDQGGFVPVNQSFMTDPDVRRLCAGPGRLYGVSDPIDWTKCGGRIHGLNEFRPYWYSLDLMLQFGPLGQRRDWEPAATPIKISLPLYGNATIPAGGIRLIAWLQSLLALILYALIAAMVAKSIRKE